MAEGVLRLAESEVEGCRNFCDKDMNHNYAYYIYIYTVYLMTYMYLNHMNIHLFTAYVMCYSLQSPPSFPRIYIRKQDLAFET